MLVRLPVTVSLLITLGCNAQFGGGGSDAGVSTSDPESPGCGEWFRDSDGDGFGDPAEMVTPCEQPVGYVANNSDCNDQEQTASPEGTEVCGDKLDNDCVGGDACMGNLVAHWVAESSQTMAVDASGGGHSGVVRGTVNAVGDAFIFNGSEADYIEIAHEPAFLLASGTVALWFRTQRTDHQGLWSKDADGRGQGGHLGISITSQREVQVRLQSDDANYWAKAPPIAPQGWHHVTVTFGSAEGFSLYVDGMLMDTNAYAGGIDGNTEPIAMGVLTRASGTGLVTPTRDPLRGSISDVRMYNRVLSSQEVAELHDVGRRGALARNELGAVPIVPSASRQTHGIPGKARRRSWLGTSD